MTLKCPIGQATGHLVCPAELKDEDDLFKHLFTAHNISRVVRALAYLVAQQAATGEAGGKATHIKTVAARRAAESKKPGKNDVLDSQISFRYED